MCGIIGYVGKNNAVPYLIDGLKNLEYRGYDSSGIALQKANEIFLLKRKGKIAELEKALSPELFSFCGIGHTRWATHGEPSAKNAHPHLSRNCSFAVVHNGIIENADTLRDALSGEGYPFISDTDTEVICHLLEKNYNGNVLYCISETVKMLEGSYALAIIHKDTSKTLFCAKKESPLLISLCSEGGFVFSDCTAAEKHCGDYYSLDDFELAEISENAVSFYNSKCEAVEKSPKKIHSENCACEKNGFRHYMLKEIYEQPSAVRNTLNTYCSKDGIKFPLARLSEEELAKIEHIYFVACGSAYHAGVYGSYIFRELTDISTSAETASEFRYGRVPLSDRNLVIIISQSGETADSIAALNLAESKGAKTLCIVNVPGSTMAQKSDLLIYTKAGKEIAVATTKAYLCQVAVLSLLGVYIGEKSRCLSVSTAQRLTEEILALPEQIENELHSNDLLSQTADKLSDSEHIYFIGRNTDYALAMEGSLKLKEISYIHCEAYAAGELKHGTISLIEKGTPVVAVCLRDDICAKTLSNIKEVKARGAAVTVITKKELETFFEGSGTVITLKSDCSDMLSAVVGAVPLQMLSYEVALRRGCEIDKPRNLAKSVTVE